MQKEVHRYFSTLLLAFAWFCMTVVGFASPATRPGHGPGLQKGNPYKPLMGLITTRLRHPVVKDRAKMYYLPTGSGVCIKKCPAKQNAQGIVLMTPKN